MKYANLLLSALFILFSVVAFSQWNYTTYTFEETDTLYAPHIRIDTASNPINLWKVGTPMKTKFDSAYYSKRAILTDTLNTYPINDTSVFYVSSPPRDWAWPVLFFWYKMDSDSLNDFGKIEVSPDSGKTWIDVVEEQATYDFTVYPSGQDIFTGNRSDWVYCSIFLKGWGYNISDSDSAIFRFTFISDGIETNQEGWMIDDLKVGWEYYQSIPEHTEIGKIEVYPNPARSVIHFDLDPAYFNEPVALYIFDVTGTFVLSEMVNPNKNTIHLGHLKPGVYTYRINETWGSLVVE